VLGGDRGIGECVAGPQDKGPAALRGGGRRNFQVEDTTVKFL